MNQDMNNESNPFNKLSKPPSVLRREKLRGSDFIACALIIGGAIRKEEIGDTIKYLSKRTTAIMESLNG